MEHAHPAKLRHHDRHIGFGNRIHRRRQDRDVQPDITGDLGTGIRLTGHDFRFAGAKQNIVERETEADVHAVLYSFDADWGGADGEPREGFERRGRPVPSMGGNSLLPANAPARHRNCP